MSAPGPQRRAAVTREDWETPPEVFGPLHDEFGFTLDAAATAANAKCPLFISVEQDALRDDVSWAALAGHRSFWLNPPYGRGLARWLRRCVVEANLDATGVSLLPANTDTLWFHEIVMATADEVRFVRGRISFLADGVPVKGNTGGSMVVVWRPYPRYRSRGPVVSSWHWSAR